MKTATQLDINWEVEAVLAWHDENAKAAIATLLDDIHRLRAQLTFVAMSLPEKSDQEPGNRLARGGARTGYALYG